MFSVVRALKVSSPAADAFRSFYSTVSGLKRRDWRTGSHPAPQVAQPDIHELEVEDNLHDEPTSQSSRPFRRKPSKIPTPHEFSTHRSTMKKAFPKGWQPPRKLTREAMDGLRSMHATNPGVCTTAMLSEKFKISPEAVRRILKSKWEPTREKRMLIAERERRHKEEWIVQRRLEEMQKQRDVARESGQLSRRKNDRLTMT